MAQAKNNFLRSRMNKDLDARILPQGEYRNALNVQISRSESDTVGSLENVLGNSELVDFAGGGSQSIGYFADDSSSMVYVFVTNYLDPNEPSPTYDPSKSHGIYSYNTLTGQSNLLISGAFLNFSQSNPIYGVNLLEELLFWTDNRNQPRKINIVTATETLGYYTKEEQISVAKNFPYQPMQLWQESQLGTSASEVEYETTMYDVSSKFYPNGGEALTNGAVSALTTFPIDNIIGSIPVGSIVTGTGVTAGTTVVAYNEPNLQVNQAQTLSNNVELVFNANPYYESTFNGDPSYLEDRFVRFSYRFRYDDGEYSVFAPFTQITFIPKQDGYFMQKTPAATGIEQDDEEAAYRTTIVEFVENKVDKILLKIPLESTNSLLQSDLKVTEIDILYKEADQLAVKVVDTIPIGTVASQSGTCNVSGNFSGVRDIVVGNRVGGIQVGSIVNGEGVVDGTTVVAFNQDTFTITMSVNQTLSNSTLLTIGEPNFFVYNYQSKKPYKTLPESEIVRVYDKVPVKAFGQEVISNRVVYSNFQDKHTPPATLDYNVNASPKADFSLKAGTVNVNGTFNNVATIN